MAGSDERAADRTGGTGTAGYSDGDWELRLYVTGRSPKCLRATENLRLACEEHLAGRYQIEVVDLLENPRAGRRRSDPGRAHGGPEAPAADPQARR